MKILQKKEQNKKVRSKSSIPKDGRKADDLGKKKQAVTTVKQTKQLKLAFLALGVLILLLILARFVNFLIGLNKPMSAELKTERKYSWDGRTSFNLAVAKINGDLTQLAVLNYHPTDQKAVILNISEDTYFDLPKGYGEWKVGSIYKLGQEEQTPIGGELLKLSLSKLLGLPVDGIIIYKDKSNKSPEALVNGWRKNLLSMANFIYSSKTDLTPLEAFKLLKAVSEVRADKLISLDFERSSVTDSRLLADSSRVLGVNKVKLDTFIRENMSDGGMTSEGLSVAIYNATDHPGLAQDVARVITNLGGDVVITSTAREHESVTFVTVDPGVDKNSSPTFKRITEVFAPQCLKIDCKSADPKIVNSRAQINIVLGEDYYNTWHKR